jgi:hypothetical protein
VLADADDFTRVRLELDQAGEAAGDRLEADERCIAARCAADSHTT